MVPAGQRAMSDVYAKIAAVAAMAVTAALVLLSRSEEPNIAAYVGLLSLGSITVFACLYRTKSLSARMLFAVAALLHGVAIFGVAAFEDDYFRFIWDGWRFLTTGAPYGAAPAEFYGAALPDGGLALTLDGVNNPHLPTIYGPTLQFIFALAYAIAGTDPMGLRMIFAAANLILIAMLARWATPERAALYAWCPLPIAEIIMHIHPDGIMAMLLMAGLLLARRYPLAAGILFGMAAGTKIVALALWPLLLRMGPRAWMAATATLAAIYAPFLWQGGDAGFGSTGVFAGQWYYNPLGFALFDRLLPPGAARLCAALIGLGAIFFLHARTRKLNDAPIALIFGVILLLAPAVNAWYLIWLLPFAVKDRMIWPFVAAAALPLSYFTGLNTGSDILLDYEVHPAAWMAELILIGLAIGWDWARRRQIPKAVSDPAAGATPILHPRISVIIPALNEEASIGGVVRGIKQQNWPSEPEVIVADNGSTDGTMVAALAAGAMTIGEDQRGYGAACLAGISAISSKTNILLFMDGDGADIPEEAASLIAPLIAGTADLVIGSRALGRVEQGAMTVPQKFGNWLATRLVKAIWGVGMTDLGPFRAIRRDSYERLAMADRDFGWTIEMQVKAVQQNLRITERPVGYRRRIGISKISGTLRGVLLAGNKILYVIAREAFCR